MFDSYVQYGNDFQPYLKPVQLCFPSLKVIFHPIVGLFFLIQLIGCATPSERFAASAENLGFTEIAISGDSFLHRLYLNPAAVQAAELSDVHIYLDGDGTPWEMNRWVADDPTPRNPLILQLMAIDKKPALLLGRPCYYGLQMTANCHFSFWTSHRYSAEIVASMAKALSKWLALNGASHVTLIGYSGGGTLAALLAPYFENTEMVVTIAANLDVDAWSRHHAYSPLHDSLNPAAAPPLPSRIKQIHLAGLRDNNVPASIIESYSRRQANAIYLPIDGFDHACCWEALWPAILEEYIESSADTL